MPPQTSSLLPHPNSWQPSDAGSRFIPVFCSGSRSPSGRRLCQGAPDTVCVRKRPPKRSQPPGSRGRNVAARACSSGPNVPRRALPPPPGPSGARRDSPRATARGGDDKNAGGGAGEGAAPAGCPGEGDAAQQPPRGQNGGGRQERGPAGQRQRHARGEAAARARAAGTVRGRRPGRAPYRPVPSRSLTHPRCRCGERPAAPRRPLGAAC